MSEHCADRERLCKPPDQVTARSVPVIQELVTGVFDCCLGTIDNSGREAAVDEGSQALVSGWVRVAKKRRRAERYFSALAGDVSSEVTASVDRVARKGFIVLKDAEAVCVAGHDPDIEVGAPQDRFGLLEMAKEGVGVILVGRAERVEEHHVNSLRGAKTWRIGKTGMPDRLARHYLLVAGCGQLEVHYLAARPPSPGIGFQISLRTRLNKGFTDEGIGDERDRVTGCNVCHLQAESALRTVCSRS